MSVTSSPALYNNLEESQLEGMASFRDMMQVEMQQCCQILQPPYSCQICMRLCLSLKTK